MYDKLHFAFIYSVCFLEWRGEGWVGSGKFKEGYAHNLRQLWTLDLLLGSSRCISSMLIPQHMIQVPLCFHLQCILEWDGGRDGGSKEGYRQSNSSTNLPLPKPTKCSAHPTLTIKDSLSMFYLVKKTSECEIHW